MDSNFDQPFTYMSCVRSLHPARTRRVCSTLYLLLNTCETTKSGQLFSLCFLRFNQQSGTKYYHTRLNVVICLFRKRVSEIFLEIISILYWLGTMVLIVHVLDERLLRVRFWLRWLMSSGFYWFWFCQSLTGRQWAREVSAPRGSVRQPWFAGPAAPAIHLPRQLIIRRRTGNQAWIRGMEDSRSRKCSHPTHQLNRTSDTRDWWMAVCYCSLFPVASYSSAAARVRLVTITIQPYRVGGPWAVAVAAGWRFLDAFSCMCPVHTLHSTATARSSCAVQMYSSCSCACGSFQVPFYTMCVWYGVSSQYRGF